MTILNLFPLQWFPKQFTKDYLSSYMIGGHAKVKVFLPEHGDYLDVFMKTVCKVCAMSDNITNGAGKLYVCVSCLIIHDSQP